MSTGNITPQWNVVADNWFATVASSVDELPDFNAEEWSQMFGTICYNTDTDKEIAEFNNTGPVNKTVWFRSDDQDEELAIAQDLLGTSNPSRIKTPIQEKRPTYIEVARHRHGSSSKQKSPKPIPQQQTKVIAQELAGKDSQWKSLLQSPMKSWAKPKSLPQQINVKPTTTNHPMSRVMNETVADPTQNKCITVDRKQNSPKVSFNKEKSATSPV